MSSDPRFVRIISLEREIAMLYNYKGRYNVQKGLVMLSDGGICTLADVKEDGRPTVYHRLPVPGCRFSFHMAPLDTTDIREADKLYRRVCKAMALECLARAELFECPELDSQICTHDAPSCPNFGYRKRADAQVFIDDDTDSKQVALGREATLHSGHYDVKVTEASSPSSSEKQKKRKK